MSQPKAKQIWTFLTGTSVGTVTDTYHNVAVKNKDTIPFSVQATTNEASPSGITMTSNATITTILALSSPLWDDSMIQVGMYVYCQDLKRKITKVLSKEAIEIDYAFPSTVTTQPLLLAKSGTIRFIRIEAQGAVDTGKLDGVAFKAASFPMVIKNPEVITYDTSAVTSQFRVTIGF